MKPIPDHLFSFVAQRFRNPANLVRFPLNVQPPRL